VTDRISRDDIVGAALELLGVGGLHALGMRQIAAKVGVQQSALYWHFENKQQLLAALADRLVAPVGAGTHAGASGSGASGTGPAGDWAVRIVSLARSLRAELLLYPDGAELVATSFAFRLGSRQPFHQFTEELESAGLVADAEVAASVILHFVFGYVTDEQQRRQAAALGAIVTSDDDRSAAASDQRFVRGLELIVAGIHASGTPSDGRVTT
jgi:AcrR family transcriptional regulator